jgi:hypothetical protein
VINFSPNSSRRSAIDIGEEVSELFSWRRKEFFLKYTYLLGSSLGKIYGVFVASIF